VKIPKNMQTAERWMRLYFGAVLFAIYFVNPFPYREWTFCGLLVMATGVLGYCPLYSLFARLKHESHREQG
jgi:hypothetical protein